MPVMHHPTFTPTYEERVVIARANLDRYVAENRRNVAAFRDRYGDPDEALSAFVRETFDQEALMAEWLAWRAERGKPDVATATRAALV
jgi:hypothetical protein